MVEVAERPGSATVLVSIPWEPEGPLPRRLEPLDISSIARPGPALSRAAPSRVRTHADGAVDVVSAPGESGDSVALRVDGPGWAEPVRLGPEAASIPGWRLIDILSSADGAWTVIELVPGPPDRVQVRRVAPDGTAIWQSAEPAGSPEALSQLLGERDGLVYAVGGGPSKQLVAIDSGGAANELQALADTGAAIFMNGSGRVGFVSLDPGPETRSWVTVDSSTGERSTLAVDPSSAWGLDLPLGMDGDGLPYGNRYGTLVRFDADGRIDWELEVLDAVVDGAEVWVAQSGPAGDGLVALPLSGQAPSPVTLDSQSAGEPRPWRLAGRGPTNSFVLYERGERSGAGRLATIGADGSLIATEPAPEDVWLRWFALPLPSAPSATDAGEGDLATRGPDGLYVIRVTPAG